MVKVQVAETSKDAYTDGNESHPKWAWSVGGVNKGFELTLWRAGRCLRSEGFGSWFHFETQPNTINCGVPVVDKEDRYRGRRQGA